MTLGFLRALVPVDRKFFPLFEKAAFNLEEGGRAIHTLAISSKNSDRSKLLLEIERIEHAGDDITHEIFNELGKNFITPFDREDIHYLATSLDDIADYIYGSAKKINFYRVDPNDIGIQKMADLIALGCTHVHKAIKSAIFNRFGLHSCS